jgi:ribosome biogenesis GTPase A
MSERGWYPGHMVATQKTIRELAPYLSAFIEVVDARAPEITRHRPLHQWIGRAPIIMVLNKSDTADRTITQEWVNWYRQSGITAVALTASQPDARRELRQVIVRALKPPYRLSVVGLPNLGKSTVLNRMVGKNRVRTGAKPGLTRGPQWIRLDDGWEWLDLPGVVTPARSRDWRLKLLGVVPVDPEDAEEVAERTWQLYHPTASGEEWLNWGRSRGYLQKGGGVDTQRTAEALIAGFRNASLGRVSLESPHDAKP